jgi:hypothetical protein
MYYCLDVFDCKDCTIVIARLIGLHTLAIGDDFLKILSRYLGQFGDALGVFGARREFGAGHDYSLSIEKSKAL